MMPHLSLVNTFKDYYAGTLRAKHYFHDDGFIRGVSDTNADTPDAGAVCSEYKDIHWENPDADIGHGQWARGEEQENQSADSE
jgi:hypothetical protein